jgi:hypothetical protein
MRWSLVRRRQYSASTDRTTCSASACRRGDLEREGSPTNRRNHTCTYQQHEDTYIVACGHINTSTIEREGSPPRRRNHTYTYQQQHT